MSARAVISARTRRLLAHYEGAAALMLSQPAGPQAALGYVRSMPTFLRWRGHPIGALMAASAQYPDRVAIVDDEGSLSFREIEERSNALARTWEESGIGPDTTIGLLARDGRLFFDVSSASQKLGANLVYLNGAFSPPQVAATVESEGIDVLVHDDALQPAVTEARPRRLIDEAALRAAVASGDRTPPSPPERPGHVVVLTSGTTGHPKGAGRSGVGSPLDGAAVLASLPVVSGDTAVIAAPLFHGFGLFGANLSLALGSTVVLRPNFDPERVLADIERQEASVLVAVPVMLQRILAVPPRTIEGYDLSSLRIVMCGGAALSADLALQFMDFFGPVLHNVYGSTESGFATVAGPKDLRAAPGTAGRPTPGVVVRIVDESGKRLPLGRTGRVLVGSGLRMDSYTDGSGKDIIDGLVVTGDLGHLDRSGRLFIDGREDDMIVSGGENVFPQEVEETLALHPEVREAAVVGVRDPEFGQRLKAFVIREEGASVSADDLRHYVHDRLARFKTPREIVFVEEFPRTATGKVKRRELGGS